MLRLHRVSQCQARPCGTRIICCSLVVFGLVSSSRTPVRADDPMTMTDRLLAEAPQIVKYLTDHHYQTVGVVKFSIKKGNQPASYNAGTLNTKMALRLEHALVMANSGNQPLTILQDVTTEAFKSSSLTLATARGRRGLLDHSYPVSWGNDKKQPDVLLTGDVLLSSDMKSATITIKAIERSKPEHLEVVSRLKDIKTDRELLASAGQSFVVSRKLSHGRSPDDAAAEDSAKRDKTGSDPLKSPDDPIKIEIFYDGQPVTLAPDAANPGELKANRSKTQADVREGQTVTFKIANSGQSKIGVVLAINGRNTLFQEDLTQKKTGECSKWILDPGETYTVNGFYMSNDGKSVFPFRVLSDAESAKVEMAPEHKGVYSVFVFREGTPSNDTALNIELARKVRQQSKSPHEAKEKLKRALHVKEDVNGRLVRDTSATHSAPATKNAKSLGSRGLVVAGNEATTGSQLKELQTKFDPEPIMSVLVRYYADGQTNPDKNQAAEK